MLCYGYESFGDIIISVFLKYYFNNVYVCLCAGFKVLNRTNPVLHKYLTLQTVKNMQTGIMRDENLHSKYQN